MSWISPEHEKIYGKAFSALYKDISHISAKVADQTGKLVNNGYQVVNELYQKWTQDSDNSDPSISETQDKDTQQEPDEEKDKIVVKFHQHEYITKIYLRDFTGRHKNIAGKLSSNKDVDDIVNTWFVYENRSDENNQHKWYPSEKLYNYYQENNILITIPIDMAVFSYQKGRYIPI